MLPEAGFRFRTVSFRRINTYTNLFIYKYAIVLIIVFSLMYTVNFNSVRLSKIHRLLWSLKKKNNNNIISFMQSFAKKSIFSFNLCCVSACVKQNWNYLILARLFQLWHELQHHSITIHSSRLHSYTILHYTNTACIMHYQPTHTTSSLLSFCASLLVILILWQNQSKTTSYVFPAGIEYSRPRNCPNICFYQDLHICWSFTIRRTWLPLIIWKK